MSIRKKIIKSILTLSLITSINLSSDFKISYADSNIENELNKVIQSYDSENIQVENGIALSMNDTLDLSNYPNWKLSNNEVVKIENNTLKPIKEGTVFLNQQIGEKVYIVEVYVFEEEPAMCNDTKQNRDYYKVFLDPGHGGSDPGNTSGSSNGITEKVINLQVSNLVKDKLQDKGIEVKMSRTGDTFPSLSQRAEMANAYGGDIYVSIHQNAVNNAPTASGIETFYHTNKVSHKPLSTDIQNNLIKETSAKNRGVKHNNFAVLRLSNMPSTLVECGFMTNAQEYANLTNSAYQEKLATAITNGIFKYLKENIELMDDPTPPSGNPISTGKVINTDSLNVRAGYGTSYGVIGTLQRGQSVEIYETKNNWHKIKYNGGTGYISGSYVQIDTNVEPEPTPPPVTPPPVDPPTTTPPTIIFTDIENNWAKDTILEFVENGYINGYEDNTFRPNDNITRAEFIKIVNKVFGFTKIDESKRPTFTDISKGAWYYDDLSIAVSKGYINGYENNTFKPNGKITRQEAAKIIATITNLNGDGKLDYKDSNQIASWAKPFVDALTDNKIMGGYEDNTFRPTQNISRAETVVTLDRAK